MIKIIESFTTLVVENNIPRDITNQLLEKAKFKELPGMTSSVLEDFFISSIEQGKNPEEIKTNVEKLIPGIKNKFQEIEEKSINLDWAKIFSEVDQIEIRKQLADGAKKLGANEEAIEEINNIKFNISESMGVSHAGDTFASVSRLQVVRKAMDYMKVFPEANFEKVVRTLMATYLAHEAGHVIDRILDSFSYNRVPVDKNWQGSESRSERFAEMWGSYIKLDDVDQEIREQEHLIPVKKTQELWLKVAEYNKKYPQTGMYHLFNLIKEKIKDNQIRSFIEARIFFYCKGTQPEIYASPYSIDELQKYV